MAEPLVELDNISMAYGKGDAAVRAIEDVTLSIDKGEFIAVVGPSGCGKSSLMKLISGAAPPILRPARRRGQACEWAFEISRYGIPSQ
jgi:NitT/TauT family transport system ATP-binding protein